MKEVYCNKTCQKAHWSIHKLSCEPKEEWMQQWDEQRPLLVFPSLERTFTGNAVEDARAMLSLIRSEIRYNNSDAKMRRVVTQILPYDMPALAAEFVHAAEDSFFSIYNLYGWHGATAVDLPTLLAADIVLVDPTSEQVVARVEEHFRPAAFIHPPGWSVAPDSCKMRSSAADLDVEFSVGDGQTALSRAISATIAKGFK